MGMFVVKHQHDAETCPAGHPQMGPMLLQHVSKPNAEANGVRIEGEAVIDGGHTLYLIVQADDQDTVDRYMTPFDQVGSVEVLPASPCEAVISRAAC